MNFSRREFLGFAGAAGATFAGGRLHASPKSSGAPRLDPDFTLLFSDCHVNGQEGVKDGDYQAGKLRETVAEILKLDPLPARAICFGDLSFLWGHRKDYETCAALLKPLEDAGIEISHGMGNHDRRSAFLESFPEYAKTTKVPGRIVSVVDAGAVDFIMLDPFQGADDRGERDCGPGFGALGKDQTEWLFDVLPKWTKPVFVCSHWPLFQIEKKDGQAGGNELKLLMMKSPMVAGYIHGHEHRWRNDFYWKDFGSPDILKILCLPSTGHWGDIGYALMRVKNGTAKVLLRQNDFWFPRHDSAKKGSNHEVWASNISDNQRRFCSFPLTNG